MTAPPYKILKHFLPPRPNMLLQHQLRRFAKREDHTPAAGRRLRLHLLIVPNDLHGISLPGKAPPNVLLVLVVSEGLQWNFSKHPKKSFLHKQIILLENIWTILK